VRNREFLGRDLARTLADLGAVPLTGHPAMPRIAGRRAPDAVAHGPVVVRWMLGQGQESTARFAARRSMPVETRRTDAVRRATVGETVDRKGACGQRRSMHAAPRT
jgi:hypothetical protein